MAALLAVLLGVFLSPGPAAAGEPAPGLLRLAHLSPDTPAVDVAVTPAGAPGEVLLDPGPTLAADLAYGDVGAYSELAAGTYAVSVRGTEAPAGTPPVLSLLVEVAPGRAVTVPLVGSFAQLAARPVPDDLSAPPAGAARLRVLAAAATRPALDVSLVGGPRLATELPFPGVGAAVTVPGGRHLVRVPGSDDVPLDLPGGSVLTLLVLDQPGGGVTLRPVVDAAGPAVAPVGGVEAGGGRPGLAAGWLPRALGVLSAAQLHAAGGVPALGAVAAPVRIRIPAVGVDAPVTGTGLDASGALVPPADPASGGWFTGGPAPGAPGPAVLTGHVDWAGRPAVFAGLARAVPGDEVLVDRADGSVVRFRITAVDRHPKSAFPAATVYAPTPAAELRLITCGGAFDRALGSYRDNVVVLARQV